jgi:hypothetical protein
MVLTYLKLLQIPSPPSIYIEQALLHQKEELTGACEGGGVGDTINKEYTHRTVTKDGISYTSRRQRRFPLGEDFDQWCKQHIDTNCFYGSICTNEGADPYHGPHIDPYRNYGLLYVIDTGGPDVKTSWWKKPNNPIMYPRREYPPLLYEDYSNLEMIESITMDLNTWYLINVRVMHSVENVLHRRITIQTSLNDSSYLESLVL